MPLGPLGLGHPALERQARHVGVAKAGDAGDGLLDAEDAKLANELLGPAHGELQLLGLVERGLVHGPLLGQVHEADHRLGVPGGHAVDDAGGAKVYDGAELLAEAAVDLELLVVDLRVQGYLDVMRHVSVRPWPVLAVNLQLFVSG